RLVGIDSIRKLTTPGSVLTLREHEASASGSRREVKKIKESNEAKEKTPPVKPSQHLCGVSVPLLPSLPLLPFLSRIAYLAENERFLRSCGVRYIRWSFAQRFACEHGKRKRLLGVSRNAK